MSEQPKPLSAEEEARLRSLLDKPHATIFRDEFEAIIATLDAERARADAAQKSCEDWQECAGNLALALKNQFHEESRTDEMREALAEFDRLASEATKGVEL